MSWVYLIMPFILIILACLCMPLVLFCMYLFGRGGEDTEPAPAGEDLISTLQVTKYHKGIPGHGECSICMCEYEIGEPIIQLKCSDKHHFHEDCAKRWFQINGLCPICRAKLNGRQVNVELSSNMNQNA